MVGRPRSKGCSTCRIRHLKCDERRPICGRCAKDKFDCGYRCHDLQVIHYSPPKSLSRIPPTIAGETDDHVFLTHLNSKLFTEQDTRVRWVGFNTVARPHTLPWKCLIALSKSFYGRVQRNPVVTRHGIAMYGQCLTDVNKSLSNAKKHSITDMLLSIMIMGFYEMLLCTSHDAWIRHGNGISTLFQLHGSAMCTDKNMFELFRSSRFLIILSSLASRRTTFLSETWWKTLPWQQQNVVKDSMDLLLDIMCDIPALRSIVFTSHDIVDTAGISTATQCALAEDALAVLNRLQEWRKTWDASPEGCIVRISTDGEQPENESLLFTSLYAANCCSLYNASLILILDTAMLSAQPGQLHPGTAITLYEKARQAALEICTSLDFQLQYSHTSLGQLFVLFPLREAGKVLSQGTPAEQFLLEQQKQKLATGQDSWEISKSAFAKYG